MEIYEKQNWIDRIVDDDTDEVIVEGSPLCARRFNHMEEGIYQLSLQCSNCNKGTSLSDILNVLGYIPNRLEVIEQERLTIPKTEELWVWNEDRELHELKFDASAFLPDDLTSSDVRKIWFKVGYTDDPDPDLLQDFGSNSIDVQSFDPVSRTITFRSFGVPEYDHEITLVGFILYDVAPTVAGNSKVAKILNAAMETAVSNGDLTKEDIAELFNGHIPTKVSVWDEEYTIRASDFGDSQMDEKGRAYRLSREYIPERSDYAIAEIFRGENLHGDQVMALKALSPIHIRTENGFILKTYMEDGAFESLGDFELPIILLFQKVEGE